MFYSLSFDVFRINLILILLNIWLMKLNKMFLVGALLSLGFASCSKEGNGPDPDNAAKSYMSMTLSMPMGSARAGDGQDQANPTTIM